MALVPLFNFTRGANYSISPFVISADQLTRLEGCLISYKLGAILKDLGYSRVSAQMEATESITGLFDFQQSVSTQRVMATMNDATDDDTQLFAKTPAGAWGEIGAAETAWAGFANINVEMEQFIGYCFFVGWGATDGFLPVGSVTGTTFSTATNVTSMAQGKYIKRYRDRLYVANTRSGAVDYPYRVYFSSVPSAGAITWTPASDFVDIDFGLDITGIESNWDRLIIFTRYNTWLYDQSSRKKVWDFGCSNHRTIKSFGQYTIWCTGHDVALSTGGQPKLIGGEVIDFIRNGNPLNFFSAIVDNECWMYVGNVTVNGISYTNTCVVYNFATDSWRIRELATNMTIFARYYDTTLGDERLYMGDTAGQVWDKSKYTDATIAYGDAQTTLGTGGTAIHSVFELTLPLGGNTLEKSAENLFAYAERAGGLKLKARALDRNVRVLKPFESIGELVQYVNGFQVDVDRGAILQIEGVEHSALPYWSFFGCEIDIVKHSNVLK